MAEAEEPEGTLQHAAPPSAATVPFYDSAVLFGGRREIVIRHGEADYRMKITRQGKLILNK